MTKKTDNKPEMAFEGKTVFYRVLSYLSKYRFWLACAIGFMVVLSLTQVGIAAILEPIINKGIVDRDTNAAKTLPFMMLGLMILRSIAGYLSSYLMSKVGRSLIRDMRSDLFHKVVYLPTSYYDKTPSTTLVSKFLYDIEQVALMATDTLANLVRSSLTVIGLLVWMIYLDWRLSLIAFISAPFIILVTRYTNKRFRKTSRDIQDSMGHLADYVKEVAQGHKAVKTYNAQQYEITRFEESNADNFKKNIRRIRVSSAIVPVTTLFIAPVFTLILFIYLNYLVADSHAVGKFVSFITAFGMLMSPMNLQEEQDSGKELLSSPKGEIEFKGVSFQYGSQSEKVTDNISFTIPAGKRVALVGASGSGKSTLASLLLRFYEPSEGSIELDGVDLNQYALKDYRSNISLVSQEAVLFDDTIRANIAYGDFSEADEVDEERLQKAIDSAHVSEFIDELNDGLDTFVGEQGLLLSGGQRQRISIARAFYKNAPIIILDEATSALDVKSEKYIQEALDKLMLNKTSVVIAHRLSTIETADQIIVMQQGKIAESGTHVELMKHDGVYADFQRSQGIT